MIKFSLKHLLLILAIFAISLAGPGPARGALIAQPSNQFATTVASYTQGNVASYDTQYGDTADWTGVPAGTTGAPEGDPGVVTPFFPPFDSSQILLIGNGGHLTLQFPNPVNITPGDLLGIFSTCGFIDNDGNGDVNSFASTFGGGLATIQVSQDNIHWVSLGVRNIDMPQSFYTNTGPYDVIPPSDPLYSNYGIPYTGPITDFANESDAQVISTLNGSAGGTWIDVSTSGLSQIDYIDFSPPPGAASDWQFAVEAVTTTLPVPIPEPTTLFLPLAFAAMIRRPKRRVGHPRQTFGRCVPKKSPRRCPGYLHNSTVEDFEPQRRGDAEKISSTDFTDGTDKPDKEGSSHFPVLSVPSVKSVVQSLSLFSASLRLRGSKSSTKKRCRYVWRCRGSWEFRMVIHRHFLRLFNQRFVSQSSAVQNPNTHGSAVGFFRFIIHPVKADNARHRPNRRGFTLVELLVVIGMIALLIGLILPALSAAREQAKTIKCLSNLHQMTLAVELYCGNYKGTYPLSTYSSYIPPLSSSISWDYTTLTNLTTGQRTLQPGLLWQQSIYSVQSCPSYEGPSNTSVAVPFTGYDYNASYLGGLPPAPGAKYSVCPPMKASQIRQPAKCAIFGDGQYYNGAQAYMRSPFPGPVDIALNFNSPTAGSQGFRHRGKTNAAFCDGHAETLGTRFTNYNPQDTHALGARTGFLSNDNSAYGGNN